MESIKTPLLMVEVAGVEPASCPPHLRGTTRLGQSSSNFPKYLSSHTAQQR